jgi:hypothetical protein
MAVGVVHPAPLAAAAGFAVALAAAVVMVPPALHGGGWVFCRRFAAPVGCLPALRGDGLGATPLVCVRRVPE